MSKNIYYPIVFLQKCQKNYNNWLIHIFWQTIIIWFNLIWTSCNMIVHGVNQTFTCDNYTISGINNTIYGNYNLIVGVNNVVYGDYNRSTGIYNTLYGRFNSSTGLNDRIIDVGHTSEPQKLQNKENKRTFTSYAKKSKSIVGEFLLCCCCTIFFCIFVAAMIFLSVMFMAFIINIWYSKNSYRSKRLL